MHEGEIGQTRFQRLWGKTQLGARRAGYAQGAADVIPQYFGVVVNFSIVFNRNFLAVGVFAVETFFFHGYQGGFAAVNGGAHGLQVRSDGVGD